MGGGAADSILTVIQSTAGVFNGSIGGAGTNENNLALVKQGAATLSLNGANTHLGSTSVEAGTLQLGTASTLTQSSSLIINASAGASAIFDINGRSPVFTGGITLGGANAASAPQVIDSADGGILTIAGPILFDGTNDPLGGTIFARMAFGNAARTLTANDSATSATDLTISGNITTTTGTNGTGLILDGTGSGLLSGTVTLSARGDNSASDLTKNGAGTWTISGTINPTDDVAHNAGTITITGAGAQVLVGDDFVTDNAATITHLNVINAIQGTSSTSNGLYGRSGATININADGALGNLLEWIILGDDNQGVGNLVMNANASIPRLDLGLNSSGEIGNVTGSGTLTVATNLNLNNGTLSANLAGAANLLKDNPFAVTVSGDNNLTGNTTLQEGTLTLDYTAFAGINTKLGTGNLTIGSATHNELRDVLNLAGHGTLASRQDVANFAVAGGPTQVNLTGTAGVDVILRITGTLSRTIGTVNFSLPDASKRLEYSGATTATNGILPAWLILNRSDFATIAENGTVDNIVAATYTVQNNAGVWGSNENITNSAAFTGTVDAACNTINSLRFDAAAASTVTIGSGNRLVVTSGGIMTTAAVGANASTIIGGSLSSGANEFFFHQNNNAGSLTIASRISGGAVIIKTGTGTLVLSGTNNTTGNITIEEGLVLATGGSAISDTSVVTIRSNGGVANTGLELAAGQTETIGTLTASTTSAALILNPGSALTITQGSAQTMAGVISGAGSLVKTGGSTLTVTGNNTHTGPVIVNQGLLSLSSTSGDLAQSASYALNGGELRSVQDQGASIDRLNNTTGITLNNTAANNAGLTVENSYSTTAGTRDENVGPLNLGAGHNIVTALPTNASASTVAVVTADTLSRGTNRATLLVRGLSLGSTATVQKGLIRFDSGGQAAVDGFEVGGGTNTLTQFKIIPWIVGDLTSAGVGNSFVTNADATTGLRPLASGEYINDSTAITGSLTDNIRYTASAGIAATPTAINSLVLDSGTAIVLTGSASSMQVASGAILAAGAGNHSIGTISGITTGGGRDYTVFVTTAASTLTLNSALTSAVPLVKAGAGTLALTNTGNLFTDVFLNQGTLQIDSLDKVNNLTGAFHFFGGGVRLAAGFVDDLSAKTWNINTGGGTIDVSLVTAGAAFANGLDDSTASSADTLNIFARSVTTGNVGLLTIQGASTFTGTTIFRNSGINGATVNHVVLNGATNAVLNGNVEIGNVANIDNTFDVAVALGTNEQIVDTASIIFRGASGENGYFKLMGFTETVAGISGSTREGVIENVENSETGVGANAKLIVNSSSDFTYNDYLRNRGSGSNVFLLEFEKQGTGTQTLMGDRIIYTGATTVTGGTLQLTDVTAFPATSVITNNAILALNRTTGTQTFANTITGSGTLLKLGSGTVTLSGVNSYSGGTTIEQGILSISASDNLGDGSATNTIQITNGSTLQATGLAVNLGANRSIALTGPSATIDVTGANVLTVPGVISGDDCTPLFKSGTGTLILTGVNIYDGVTTVAAGTLQVGNGGGTGTLGDGEVVDNAALTFNRSNLLSVANHIGGTGALSQNGTGTTVLSGTNTYSGVTTVNSGTLQFAQQVALYNHAPASWTATNLVVNAGATAAFNIGGIGEFSAADINTLQLLGTATGGLRNGSNIGLDTTNAVGTFTYASVIANPNSGANSIGLTKLGTGTLALTAPNSYTGATTIGGGTLSIASLADETVSSSIGRGTGTASGLVLSGGSLEYTGDTAQSTNRLFSVGTAGGSLNASGNGVTAAVSFTGTGALGFNGQSGPRTLTLTGSNTGNNTLAAVIGDNGGATSVVKSDAGTWILSGTSTYTGATNVDAGELVIAGSLAGDVSVAAGPLAATLSSDLAAQVGKITALSSNNGGATIDPGRSGGSGTSTIGVLTADGDVTLGVSGTIFAAQLKIEIGGTTAGTEYDRVHVAGANRGVSLDNVELSLTAVNGYAFAHPTHSGDQFLTDGAKFFVLTLAESGSSVAGAFHGTNLVADGNLPGYSTINLGGQLFAINYTANSATNDFAVGSGNDVALMAIPEPNSLAMLAGSLGLAVGLQRFRRRQR